MSSLSVTFRRLLISTGSNLTRNKLLTFATILVIILIVFFFNILGSINYLSDFSIESINKKVDLTLELKEGVDINNTEVEQLRMELETQGTTVVKISKEKALEDFKQILPDLGTFLETYRQNPLPASLYVTAKSLQDYQNIATIIEKPEYQSLVNFDQNENSFQNQRDRIYKILDVATTVKRLVLILQLLFSVIAVIIILNTIQIVIHNRREEIKIMKLVGASKEFITLPFVLEGITYGVVGVVVGFGIYLLGLNIAYANIQSLLPIPYLKSFASSLWSFYNNNIAIILLQQLIIFIIIGSISSLLALSRFLKFFSTKDLIFLRKKVRDEEAV